MKLKIEVPKYNSETGFTYKWENGFEIETKIQNGTILIIANKEGLISLANHFLNVAQEEVPNNYHLHLDEINSLEKGSVELIIQKKKK